MADVPSLSLPTAAGVAVYPPGATFGPRRMRDFEFVWMIEGDAQYRRTPASSKGREVIVEAPAGSIVLCRPGAVDFFQWDRFRRTRHAYFHFNVLALPNAWPRPETWALSHAAVDGDVLRPLFRHLLTWTSKPGNGRMNESLTRLTMQHMLTAFVTGRVGAGDVPVEAMPEPVERTMQFLRDRLDADPAVAISLDDLATAACVTPEHLCRIFRTATGLAPMQTVRLARLDRAAVLLARSNYAVGQIAELCGFASPFHFSRAFRSAYGRSPQQLRRNLAAGDAPPRPRLLRYISGLA